MLRCCVLAASSVGVDGCVWEWPTAGAPAGSPCPGRRRRAGRPRSAVAVVTVLETAARELVRKAFRHPVAGRGPVVAVAGRGWADGDEVELEQRGSSGRASSAPCQSQFSLRMRSTRSVDQLVGPASQPQVAERFVVDWEDRRRGAVLGRHVPDRGSVRQPERARTAARDTRRASGPTPRLRSISVTVSTRSMRFRGAHRSGGTRPPAGRTFESASPSIAASASIPPRCPDRRPSTTVVCESVPTNVSGNAWPSRASSRSTWWRSRAGADDLQVGERLLAPAQEGIALAVALELELDVAAEGEAGGELVDLDEWSITSSAGMTGLISPGPPPRSCIAFPLPRSTIAGTPVKSWWMTRLGRKEISRLGLLGRHPTAIAPHRGCSRPAALQQDAQRVGKTGDVLGAPARHRAGRSRTSSDT